MDSFFSDIWGMMVFIFWFMVIGVGLLVAGTILQGVATIAVGKQEAKQIRAALEPAKQRVRDIVTSHLETLVRKRAAMVRLDAYGVVEADGWQKETQHFVDKVIVPQLTPIELSAIYNEGVNKVFQELVEDRVAAHQELTKSQIGSIEGLSPFEFEQWCESQLQAHGWQAQRTKNGADQGADVIAEKDGLRVAVQCKLYNRPVGNKAVQEAFASRQFYRTQVAAVITNAGFTPSARQLATSTGVILLSHTEIDQLHGIIDQD